MNNNGQMPQQSFGAMYHGQKPLFITKRDDAQIDEGQYKPGFGYLEPGQMLAEHTVDSFFVPYVPDTYVIGVTKGVTPVIADIANAATTCYVAMAESYKFAVGDSLILRQGTTYADVGLITAIDRTTDNWRALITFTTATAVATFTTANSTVIYHKAGTTGKFSTAAAISDSGTDTGYGYNNESNVAAKGALSSVVFRGAILWKRSLVDYDSTALTGLSARTLAFVRGAKIFI
jgi:hypothetical protein